MAIHAPIKLLVVVSVASVLAFHHFAVLALPRVSPIAQEYFSPVNQGNVGTLQSASGYTPALQEANTQQAMPMVSSQRTGARLLSHADLQQRVQDKHNPLQKAFEVYATLPDTLIQMAKSGYGRVQKGAERDAFTSIMLAYCTINQEVSASEGLVVLAYFGATTGSVGELNAQAETKKNAIYDEFYPFEASHGMAEPLPITVLRSFVHTSSKALPGSVPFTAVITGSDGWHLFRFGQDEFEQVDKLIQSFRTAPAPAAPAERLSMSQSQYAQPPIAALVPSQLQEIPRMYRRSPIVGAIVSKTLVNTALSGAQRAIPKLFGNAAASGVTAGTNTMRARALGWLGKNVPGIFAGTAATALYRQYSEGQTKQEAITQQSEIFTVCNNLYCAAVGQKIA